MRIGYLSQLLAALLFTGLILAGNHAHACKISIDGGARADLGTYNRSSRNLTRFNMRISCANNKVVTLAFSSANRCQLRRRNSIIPYEVYVDSDSRNYCGKGTYRGGFTQNYLLGIFARPVTGPLTSGVYTDELTIELTF